MELFRAIFDYTDTYSPAICLLVMVYRFRKIPEYLKTVFWYLVFCILVFGVTNWYAERIKNNLFLYHFITIIEFGFLATYISKSVSSASKKRIIFWCGILLGLFFILNLCFFENLRAFPSYLISMQCFLLIGCSFLYYADMIETSEVFEFKRQPAFWIITGIFVYSAVCFFVFFFYKSGYISKEFRRMTWRIQEIMILVKYALFIIGIVWSTNKK